MVKVFREEVGPVLLVATALSWIPRLKRKDVFWVLVPVGLIGAIGMLNVQVALFWNSERGEENVELVSFLVLMVILLLQNNVEVCFYSNF